MIDSRPIILTATMDAEAQWFFDQRRSRHFPSERNMLDAHLTLFHALPGRCQPQIAALLDDQAAKSTAMAATVTGLRNLGGGVAYEIHSEGLAAYRRRLAEMWFSWLTPQDRQTLKAHVTVQNKVTPAQARQTAAYLSAEFSPFDFVIGGVTSWRYDGGPWTRQSEHAFLRRDLPT